MNGNILEELKVVETILENEEQEVFICKNKITEELFVLNSITNTKLTETLDSDKLKNTINNVVDVVEIEDRLNIISRYMSHNKLKDYVNKNELYLSDKVKYVHFLLNMLYDLREFQPHILSSIFNYHNFVIDGMRNIHPLGLIILEENYLDIDTSNVLKNIARLVYTIFTGNKIIDGDTLDKLPPDISKIITKCKDNKYTKYRDLLEELETSTLYQLMNNEEHHEANTILEEDNIVKNKGLNKKGLIFIIIIVLLLPIIIFSFNKLNIEEKSTINDEIDDDVQKEVNKGDNHIEKNKLDKSLIMAEEEELESFFKKSEDSKICIDKDIYHSGKYSIRVDNDDINEKYFIGMIDLNSEEFNHLKNKKTNLSMWIKSKVVMKPTISIELFNKGKFTGIIDKNIGALGKQWTLHNMSVNIGNAEQLKLYVSSNKESKIWFDAYEIEVLK
ncbi:hypothetical protein [Dethiothermospora halolimnae]|uniref:hypothetical protein n=1 Tax=Dethiothermospora halolimnae TaxID=3114390 RepID=UPI003CCB9C0A